MFCCSAQGPTRILPKRKHTHKHICIYKYMEAVSLLKHEDNSSQPIQDCSAHCGIKKSTWSGEMPNTPWFPAKSVKFQISVRFISAAVTFAAPKTLNSDELHIWIGYIFSFMRYESSDHISIYRYKTRTKVFPLDYIAAATLSS